MLTSGESRLLRFGRCLREVLSHSYAGRHVGPELAGLRLNCVQRDSKRAAVARGEEPEGREGVGLAEGAEVLSLPDGGSARPRGLDLVDETHSRRTSDYARGEVLGSDPV